jgi:hypothetical protein
MGKAQLKVNMIIDGKNYPFGTVLDEEFIPERLRTPEYLGEPAAPEPVPDVEGYDIQSELDAVDYEQEMEPARTKAEKRAFKRGA